MNLLTKYQDYLEKRITEQELAEAFGMTVRVFRFRKTRWADRLPLLLSILDGINEDKITRSEAATALNVTEREVNQLMRNWGISRPIKEYKVKRVKSELKWEIRKKYSIDFISGHMELEDAAIYSGVSPRQMRRWITDLLKKHFGMEWSDLRMLSNEKRYRIADEIERAEDLELSKQQVLNSISAGRRSLESEALNRIISRKKNV